MSGLAAGVAPMIQSSGVKSFTSSLDSEDGGVAKGALDEATPREEARNGPGAIGLAGTDGVAANKVATSGAAGGVAVALHPPNNTINQSLSNHCAKAIDETDHASERAFEITETLQLLVCQSLWTEDDRNEVIRRRSADHVGAYVPRKAWIYELPSSRSACLKS